MGKVDNDSILVLDKAKHLEHLKAFKLKRIFTDGVFSNQGLLEMVQLHLNFEKISASPVTAFVTCSNCRFSLGRILKRSLELTFPPQRAGGDYLSLLLASSAILYF